MSESEEKEKNPRKKKQAPMTLEKVQQVVSLLSPEDRDLLLLDLTERGLVEDGIHPDVVIVYNCFQDILKSRYISSPPFVVFEKGAASRGNRKRLEKMNTLLSWLDESFRFRRRQERERGILFGAHFLTQWMEEKPIPLSMQSMTDNCLQIPTIVERAFPGAARGGHLMFIANRYLDKLHVRY